MSMLLSTINPRAAAEIGNPTKVGVGSPVVYHARAGYMRDRRSSFPALVMRQHEDDGSVDLLVFMEREDFAFEQRVAFQSHNAPHHCWSAVENAPVADDSDDSDGGSRVADIVDAIYALTARVATLEAARKPGRPKKKPAGEI